MACAPNPLYGLSPRLWAGSVFALDGFCCQAKSWAPSSAVETATVDLDASAPDLLARHLVFDPGGSVGWENYCRFDDF